MPDTTWRLFMQLKLDGLLASQESANFTSIGIETATEDSLREIAAAYSRLADEAAAQRGARPEKWIRAGEIDTA